MKLNRSWHITTNLPANSGLYIGLLQFIVFVLIKKCGVGIMFFLLLWFAGIAAKKKNMVFRRTVVCCFFMNFGLGCAGLAIYCLDIRAIVNLYAMICVIKTFLTFIAGTINTTKIMVLFMNLMTVPCLCGFQYSSITNLDFSQIENFLHSPEFRSISILILIDSIVSVCILTIAEKVINRISVLFLTLSFKTICWKIKKQRPIS